MIEKKAMDLFEAYSQNQLPLNEGYIVSSFFKDDSAYSVYEIVSYSTVKDIYLSQDGLNFQTNGKKLYLLAEPANYTYKSIEPVFREKDYQVPLRFKEANIITCKNLSHVMFNKKPTESLSSFTVIRPTGINFSFIFYVRDDVFSSIQLFFEKTLSQEAQIPLNDAKKIAKTFAELCSKSLIWKK
ncbi:MAG: hypothetical protein ACTTKH_03635 [Treponema sp.]